MVLNFIKHLIPRKIKKFIKKTICLYHLRRDLKQKKCKIIVASGGTNYKGWAPTDIECLNLLRIDDWERFFSKRKIDAILAEDVWEHLTLEEGIRAAKNCFRYLKKNGYIRVAVPDGFHPDPKYIDWVKPKGIGPGADDHKILYNYKTLKKIFEKSGFKVKLLEYFDEEGKFNYNSWNPKDGMINRSKRFDKRNKNDKLNYTSIILDAVK